MISCPFTDSFPSLFQESVIGIGMFSLAILAPAGWILAHLEDYKKKE